MKHVLVCVIAFAAACDEADVDIPVASCGDGVGSVDEECDDGNTTNADFCTNECTYQVCGDGIVGIVGEECDDGNNDSADGCSSGCELEDGGCGDGIIGADEDCDDVDETSFCDIDCTFAECGDGHVNPLGGEECDDGNTEPDDGCSPACTDEVVAVCPAVATLMCGGPTVFGNIGGPGTTDLIDAYTCLAGDRSGSEVIHEWIAPASGDFTVFLESSNPSMTGVVVVEADAACGITTCHAGGIAGTGFTAVAGTRYLVIVDSDPNVSIVQYGVGMICPP